MNKELKALTQAITKYSLILGVSFGAVGALIFRDGLVALGILIGNLTGLLGYFMIVQMAINLTGDEKTGKKTGIFNYSVRYLLYALIFCFCVFYLKISVVSLLVGILSHKASIYIYSILKKEREDENGSN
ncbi:MAG: hypothetical protein Q4C49_09240 [Bacillota bacterium]|nr:hypothetical protein [Bacillota bacterium]